jgi:nucleoside-diphosphate-sugar epimerase
LSYVREALLTRHRIIEEDLKRITSSDLDWGRFFGKSVLISGANGFLPAYMLETLLYLNDTRRAGIRVLGLVRNRERALRRLGNLINRPDLTLSVQDVRDSLACPGRPEFVIHAASQASPKYFASDPVGTFESNVLGTQRMLQVANHSRCEGFLFFSSGEVYGQLPDPSIPVTETSYGPVDPMNIRSCYAEGKRAGESLCVCWHAQFGVPAKIVRISHTYGPGMALDDGRVFADFVADIVGHRDIVIKSDGSARRPFCYLADATIAYFTVLLNGKCGEAYNVGSDIETSIRELAEMLCKLFPERSCKVICKERTADDRYLPSSVIGGHFDISKIRALGWKPTTTINEGFKRTVLSYEQTDTARNA